MNLFSSATLKVGLLRLPPPDIIWDVTQLERWYYRLTPAERSRFTIYLNQLIDSQPVAHQQKIRQIYNRLNASAVTGLGQWAAVIGTAIQATVSAGTSIYQGKQAASLQRDLAGKRLGTEAQIAAVQSLAQKGIEEAYLEAQKEAAATAGAAQVAVGQQAATASVARTELISKALVPIGIGAVALGGLFLLFKMKKR